MTHTMKQATVLFLGAAVVLFATILTGYTLLRLNDPGAFTWAPTLLNRTLGWLAAGTFVVTSLAAAAALRLALKENARLARVWLGAALVTGLAALAVRLVEMPSICLHAGLAPTRVSKPAGRAPANGSVATIAHVGEATQGKRIFLGTCAACHAPDGSGVKGQGQNLRDSTFLKGKTDEQALAFVKAGRQPFDPESKLHLAMPARGGNPSLSDASLLDAIAYVRELEKQAAAAPPVVAAAGASPSPAVRVVSPDQPQVIDGELWLPHSILPAAQAGPEGSARNTIALQKPGAEGHLPSNVRRFFSILLFANGLHVIYLVFGLLLGLTLVTAASRGGAPKNSLAVASAYWVVIGGIGLIIVQTFYL